MSEIDTEALAESQRKCIDRFIELANKMKDEGMAPGEVSNALMSVSGIYATYAIAGNDAALNEEGVEKLAQIYKERLGHIQRNKKDQRSTS